MNESSDAINWIRWAVYLLAGVPLVTWLLFTRNQVLRLLVVVIVGLFIQDSLMGRRHVLGGMSISPAVVLASIALVAEVMAQRRMPQLGAFLPLWLGFLFFAGIGIPVGSIGTGFWGVNIKQFQQAYLEGIVFFTYGIVALRRDDQLLRFLHYSMLVGLGVALVHIGALATGFRFRNARATDGVYYAGIFDNTNSIGSYYVMMLPVGLAMVVGKRLSPRWKLLILGSITGMMGSLILSGSRGGVLFSGVMSVIALAMSRIGVQRAVTAAVLASITATVGYFALFLVLPSVAREVLDIAADEGFETSRFALFASYAKMLLDHPLGVGLAPANFSIMLREYGIPGVVSAHNIYLDIALQTGVIGLLMFLSICGVVLLRNRRAQRLTRDAVQREVLVYLFLSIVGFLAVGFFEPIYTISTKLNSLFWLTCGLSVGASQRVFAARRAESDHLYATTHDPLPSPPHAQHA